MWYYSVAGVAEEILNKCVVPNPEYKNLDDVRYSALFNYEFIEDVGEG